MDARSLRIALLLLVIYLAGLTTGRFLLPPKTEIVYANMPSPGGGPNERFNGSRLLELLRNQCHITPAQADRIRPVLEAWRQESMKYPPNARPQLELWEKCVVSLRNELTPEQLPVYEALVAEGRKRMQRRMGGPQ